MPSVPPGQMVAALLDAFEQSLHSAILTSSVRAHPRTFSVSGPMGPLSVWVYVWTLTPGGRPQLADEYRIQMTGVRSPLPTNPDGPTLLLGYEPNLKMFAGFDLARHGTFTPGSPSVQIDITALNDALQNGLAFARKENGEIAVGIRPDQLVAYARTAAALHDLGEAAGTHRLLAKAAKLEPLPADEMARLPLERRRIVSTVSRLSRDANFRQQVLFAYGSRCAVTRMQLNVVDAAHVLPVGAPGSIDHVTNGLALSSTFHRAYDSSLIYLDESYNMRVNPEKAATLRNQHLDSGLDVFETMLGRIHLPPDRRQWPDPQMIRKANAFRNIAVT